MGDGAGPLFHRRYVAVIRDAELAPEELMASLQRDPDSAAPSEFATFKKTAGNGEAMRPGDEYVVRMPGPWDGPVRVVDVGPRSFRLMTLEGHLEAGQIAFRADGDGDRVEFEIESWARSGDRLSNLLYDRLRMSKEIQLHMWTSFLERVIRLSGGKREGGLRIETRRVERVPAARMGELDEVRAGRSTSTSRGRGVHARERVVRRRRAQGPALRAPRRPGARGQLGDRPKDRARLRLRRAVGGRGRLRPR